MCGIFFSIGFENLPDAVIDSVAHRGPDGRGWNDFASPQGPVVMAHRRLAIIDLSADGHQPMSTEDGRYWITYNGEIYNYLEIKKELEKSGVQFKTKTDTEVLLKSYLTWGADCLNHFNGMFAFVIWDDQEKKAFAARDRFGIKPLYYYKGGNKVSFASEIKQFKHFPKWQAILNKEMAQEYLQKNYCDHKTETLYKNVFQVLPGHYLECDATNENNLSVTYWYDLSKHIQPIKINDFDAIAQFKALFEDAIRLRLRSDVSIGTCLSGGLDSSSIVSMLRYIDPSREIHTFSAVFPGSRVDESVYIEELALEKNLNSYKNYPSSELFLENLDKMLYFQDLPFSSTSPFAQWKTFESAKNAGITVLLDGQGADESLLGYPGMFNAIFFDYLVKGDLLSAINFIKWQAMYNKQSFLTTIILAIQQRFPGMYRLLLKITGRGYSEDSPRKFESLNDICVNRFLTNLQTLLRYEDRNSMAFSIESRLPFLDYRLVEFIFSLSIHQRFRAGQTKWVLREAMKGINIRSILNRKDKIGFATPQNAWWKAMHNKINASEERKGNDFRRLIFERWLKNENLR